MAGKQAGTPLSSKAIEMMKPTDKDKADTGENRGLRVGCGSTLSQSFVSTDKMPTHQHRFSL
ncbi:integrase [Sodalis ligni]|uniref:integrase n=1 Tax=Sodalis ligni TaxID=2697027 RepID=UPI001BDE7617|nr:integrase [Sodalis ligni]